MFLLKDSRKLPRYYYFSGVPDIPDSKIFAFFVLLRPLLSTLLSPLPSYGVCVVSCVVHFRKCEKLVESSPPPFFFVRFPFYQQCIPGERVNNSVYSGIRCLVSVIRYPLSVIRYPLSGIRYPVSAMSTYVQ